MSTADERHARDTLSLMAGLLLVLLAGGFLLADLTAVDVDGRWVAPAVLIAVGATGLLSSLRRRDAVEEPGGPRP